MVKAPTVPFSSATADIPMEEVTSGDASADEGGMKVNKHVCLLKMLYSMCQH